MLEHQHIHGNHDAPVFACCYTRIADFIRELVDAGRHPRVMLDYSGELLFGLRQMGRGDMLDNLKSITLETGTGHTSNGWAPCGGTPSSRPRRCPTWSFTSAPGSTTSPPSSAGTRWARPGFLAARDAPAEPSRRRYATSGRCGNAATTGWWCRSTRSRSWTAMACASATCRSGSWREQRGRGGVDHGADQDAGLRHQARRPDAAVLRGAGPAPARPRGRRVPPIVTQISDGENGGVMMNEFPGNFRQVWWQTVHRGLRRSQRNQSLELVVRERRVEQVFEIRASPSRRCGRVSATDRRASASRG